MVDDNVQHGIDDDPNNDAEKGAAVGGLGGAAVGAMAGAAAGPVGAVVGAVVGGLTGAGASGLAVGAVDAVDNDNTVTGIGSGATGDVNRDADRVAHDTTLRGSDIVDPAQPTRTDVADSGTNAVYGTTGTTVTHTSDVSDMNIDRGVADTPNVRSDTDITGSVAQGSAIPEMGDPDLVHGPEGISRTGSEYDQGIQAPTNIGPDGTSDTRGITEKTADAVTGDDIDDKTGNRV